MATQGQLVGWEDPEKGCPLPSLLVARRGGYRVIFKPADVPSRELGEHSDGLLGLCCSFVLLLPCTRQQRKEQSPGWEMWKLR